MIDYINYAFFFVYKTITCALLDHLVNEPGLKKVLWQKTHYSHFACPELHTLKSGKYRLV